tara:strand:+ start:442 stop:918 length:477 start_codon:yes stop_codon:yes gene_type:complete
MSSLPRLVTHKYDRPEETYQDTLQNKTAMLEQLENYERIENIEDIPLKTHIKYVTLHSETRKQVFRVGGTLERINPKYILLSNGEFKWSVQRYHYCDDASTEEPVFETVFWRLISKEERLNIKLEELQEENNALKEKLNEIIEENIKLKNFIEDNYQE